MNSMLIAIITEFRNVKKEKNEENEKDEFSLEELYKMIVWPLYKIYNEPLEAMR